MNKKHLIIYSLLSLIFVISIISFAISISWCADTWEAYRGAVEFYGSHDYIQSGQEIIAENWRQSAILTVVDVFSLVSAIASAATLIFLNFKVWKEKSNNIDTNS